MVDEYDLLHYVVQTAIKTKKIKGNTFLYLELSELFIDGYKQELDGFSKFGVLINDNPYNDVGESNDFYFELFGDLIKIKGFDITKLDIDIRNKNVYFETKKRKSAYEFTNK